MISPSSSANEALRLAELEKYGILDTASEQSYEDLTSIASEICGTPIALISLVDRDRQWFKSRLGLEASQTSREISFCGHAILGDDLFVINDATQDLRFHDNPLVLEDPHIRFYAGSPLITPRGEHIGTLCVIDRIPRELTDNQKDCLLALSRQVITLLEQRLALQEAREATEAKTVFLANMSHEIRTPLHAITSCTNLLIDMADSSEQLRLLKLMREAGTSLTTLINDILDLSRIDINAIELHESSFDLYKIAEDVVSILDSRARKGDIAIHLEIADPVPQWIWGDAERLRQILYNLVGNALKFASHRVNVSFDTKKTDDLDWLLIKVSDDGKGIPEEYQKQIFDRYTQVDASDQGRESGTGLGLTICQSICRAMRGTIWVESVPGAGATFSIQLPLQVSEPSAKAAEDLTLSDIAGRLDEKLPLRVLVAEDSAVNQFIIKAMLDKLVHSTDVVSDGNEAVEASHKEDYDVILMDIQMPNMDGIEATRKIRESTIKQPAIIALTANAFQQDKFAAEAAGVNGYVTKPINLESLFRELMSVIS